MGAALAAGAWLLYFMAVTLLMPYPIEYREGAAQVVTQLLLSGENPFAPANQPLGMTNYGIVFSIAVWPLAALFGNTLLVHRLLTVLFLLLSAYLVARTAFGANQQMALSVAGAELAAAALATRGGLGGYPSSMGAFFFVAAIAIPFERQFDRRGLLLSAAASLLALYAKPYFVLGFGIVAGYAFLFVSKKAGLLYALGFGAATALTALVIRNVLPLYFYDTVFNNLSQAAQNDAAHMLRQLRQLVIEFLPLVVAGLLVVLAGLAAWRGWPERSLRIVDFRNLPDLNRPVFSVPLGYFGFAAFCTLLAFMLILGPHPENYMNYAYQLVVPVFVLWLLVNMRPQRSLTPPLTALILLNLALFCLMRLPPGQLQQSAESAGAWRKLYSYAEACQRPLNSPTVVPVMIKRGLWPLDSGHTEYFFGSRPIPGMRWFGANHDVVLELGERYLSSMRSAVAHQEFDCIMLARYSGWPRDLPLERGGYRLADTMVVAMPQTAQTWQMDIWVPDPE